MFPTEKRLPIDVPDRGRPNNRLIIASMLLTAAISYALVVLHPGLVQGLGGAWARSGAPAIGNPPWALPAIAASVAIGAASLTMLLLSAFVNGVQRAPYLWLSPVLVGFSTLVMSRLHVQLPFIGVPVLVLTALAGLVVLGGGALLQMGGFTCSASGLLLLLLPGTTLIAGYVARAGTLPLAWLALDTPSALYLFVLLVTSAGVAIVALIADASPAGGSRAAALHMRQQLEQLVTARERARLLELHLNDAQRRADHAEYQLRSRGAGVAREDTAEFVALARPQLQRWAPHLGFGLLFTLLPLAVYFGVYRPLTKRIAAQQALAAEVAREHVDELAALRRRFDAERQKTLAMISAARRPAPVAAPAAEAAPAPAPQAVATTAPAPEATPKPEATAAPHEAQARARARIAPAQRGKKAIGAARAAGKRAKKPAAAHRAPAAATNAAPETDKALKESVNDDPIGGLD
jgi:hypothetical protein